MVTFDEVKRRANLTKHGIDLATLSDYFDGELLTSSDVRMAYNELRFQSVGWHDAVMVVVVWTPGDNDLPRIISARKAVKHERESWTRFYGRYR